MIDVIGLDMDGVMVDLAKYQFDKGIPYFSKRLSVSKNEVVKDSKAYDVEDIFGVTKSERMRFWAFYIWQYCLNIRPNKGASEMTHKWHEEGRKVQIITSRVYVMDDNLLGELFRKMVGIYLKKYNIYYDEIVFCEEKNSAKSKSEACDKLSVKLMVDDKNENINEISSDRLVLCYNNPWNEEGLKEGIERVNDFYDIDVFIKKYELQNSKRYINLPRRGER